MIFLLKIYLTVLLILAPFAALGALVYWLTEL